MSISDWLLGTLCVLAFVIAIQIGLVWRILSEFIGIANRIKDIGMYVIGINRRMDILIGRIKNLNPSKREKNRRETNMDHLKSIKSSKEMSKILNNAPWCPSANGNLCVDPNDGNWDTCARCREKWLDAPYEEEF